MEMKQVKTLMTKTYQYGKYIIEISGTYGADRKGKLHITYDAYISDPKYGVKSYMFGAPAETTFDEFVDLVKANAEGYAKIYAKAYGDEVEHDAEVDAKEE